MAYVDWRMRGPEITGCNCDWGCPCQFNALPTRGDCRALAAMRIDMGYFGETRLDGLKWAAMLAWPGAIHFGRGEVFHVIDERADPAQRDALIAILSGEETEPGATIFNVFAGTIETLHPPQFRPIDFAVDLDARTGHVRIAGIVDTAVEPIRNPVTGAEHRVKVSLANSFEYREAEYASSTVEATGPVPLSWSGRHAHVAMLDLTTAGVV